MTEEDALTIIEDHIKKGFGIPFAIKSVIDSEPKWLTQNHLEVMYGFAIALSVILEYHKQGSTQLTLEL